MNTAPSSVARYLRAPRLPRTCPVVVLHIRAHNDGNGNPRRAFVVLAPTGRTVEVVDEGYGGEGELRARFPWFSHTAARALGIECAYAVPVYVAPSEYHRWIRAGAELDTISPDVSGLRALADRAQRWMAVREALTTIRRTTAEHEWREERAKHEGRENLYADSSSAVVYHRHPDDGGDATSDHLRRAMAALVRAGMVERVEPDSDARPFFRRSVGHYRATPKCPEL